MTQYLLSIALTRGNPRHTPRLIRQRMQELCIRASFFPLHLVCICSSSNYPDLLNPQLTAFLDESESKGVDTMHEVDTIE